MTTDSHIVTRAYIYADDLMTKSIPSPLALADHIDLWRLARLPSLGACISNRTTENVSTIANVTRYRCGDSIDQTVN
jgi:hypothetical protein